MLDLIQVSYKLKVHALRMSVIDVFMVCSFSFRTHLHEHVCLRMPLLLTSQDDGSSLLSTLLVISIAAFALLFLKGYFGKSHQDFHVAVAKKSFSVCLLLSLFPVFLSLIFLQPHQKDSVINMAHHIEALLTITPTLET